MENTSLAQTKQRTRSAADSQSGVDSVTKGSIAVMGGVSALIGLWAAACLFGAMVESGGVFALVKNWITATMGL